MTSPRVTLSLTTVLKPIVPHYSNFTTHAVDEATPPTQQAAPSSFLGQPWRIVAAACVQRLPLLSREKSEIELRVDALKDTLRAERSRLSNFELEERENQRLKRQREKRALEEDLDEVQVSTLTVLFFFSS